MGWEVFQFRIVQVLVVFGSLQNFGGHSNCSGQNLQEQLILLSKYEGFSMVFLPQIPIPKRQTWWRRQYVFEVF
jgi:hypothetical protein